MEQAGADALELNTYALATDRAQTSGELESQLLKLVESVCQAVKIPVAVKLSQSFTALPNLVGKLEEAGARGVVLFNRFYQPDFDIETLEVRPHAPLLDAPPSCCRACTGRPFSMGTSTSTSPSPAASIRPRMC